MSGADPGVVDFRGFVASLAATAAMTLNSVEGLLQPAEAGSDAAGSEAGEVEPLSPEDRAKQIEHGLATARHLIDTIAMLEEKTAGNLTDEERQLVQSSITELRMSFVRVAGKAKQGG